MAKTNWTDGSDNWTTAADWSTGAPPASGDDAILDQGFAVVDTNVGTVNSVTLGSNGGLNIENGGSLATGDGGFANFGSLVLDLEGSGGSSLTVNGQLLNLGLIAIGNGKQTSADTVTASTFVNGYEVDLLGGTTNAATLAIAGSTSAASAGGLLYGSYVLSGDALLQFGSGQFTGIYSGSSLSISGTNAFVSDAGATGSDSALALASNAGSLTLDNGASLTTAAGFVNMGVLSVANSKGVATKTTLDVDNSTAAVTNANGALDSDVSVSGNSLIEFAGGGQITSIGQGATLSIDGANAFVADAGATGSNSAVGALTGNADQLYLDDGASLTTGAGFTSTDILSVANTEGVATTTTLTVDNSTAAFEGSSGAFEGFVTVSGNSAIEFTGGGQITSIGQYAGLEISGQNAFLEDAGATGSNSAIALASNAGTLTLDDGASLTTAAGFTSTEDLEIDNTAGGATATTLVVDNSTGAVTDPTGALDSIVSVSGNSLLEFSQGGQITSIASTGDLSLDGASAFVADAGATGSNSALALASNAGQLNLDDGADLTTAAGFVSTGAIDVANTQAVASATTLVVDNSTASVEDSTGALDTGLTVKGNSVLDFEGGGQITANNGGITLDGASAFIADAGATGSSSAIALSSNAGYLALDDGASLTTSATFVNNGLINLGLFSTTTATSTLVAGSATSFAPSGVLGADTSLALGNDSLLEFADGGQITGIGSDAQLAIDGTAAFVADAGATTSNSALAGLASIAADGSLDLEEGASVTTTGALANAGGIELGIGPIVYDTPPAPTTLDVPTPPTTTLDINSTAGLGTAGVLSGSVDLGDNSLLEFAQGGQITSLAADASLSLDGPEAFIADAGATTSNSALAGLAGLGESASLSLAEGASITTSGALAAGDAGISLDDGAALTVGGALSSTGPISLGGGWTVPTTLDVEAPAGFGTAGTVTGHVAVSGNSVLEFSSGQLTTIAASGSLDIEGAEAFVADAGATTSNSALAGLADNAGGLALGGASVTTTGALTNTGSIELDDGTLVTDGTTAGFLDSSGNLDGNVDLSDTSLLEFEQGGQITGIGASYSLSIDGAGAFVADGGATTSNSALDGLADNGGTLTLEDGAVITTTGGLANTGDITLSTPAETGAGPLTILDIDSAAGFGTAGEVTGSVDLSGNSLLEFAGNGQITSIGDASSDLSPTLSIDGTNAFLADANATTSNSALDGLASNFGTLDLEDGAVVTTTGALSNSGNITLGSEAKGAPQTILDIGSAAGFGTPGELTGYVDLSGSSLLEFAGGGQITSIGDQSGLPEAFTLSIDGPNAVLADAGATTSNSALDGLASNYGGLTLQDGAVVTTNGALANTGYITLGTEGESAASTGPLTILDINSQAGLGTAGLLTGSVSVTGNSLLEFAGNGSITRIDSTGSLLIGGTNAFFADASAPNSNGALSSLAENDGTFDLTNGASVTTNGSLNNTNSGSIYLASGYSDAATKLTVEGTLTSNGNLTVGDYGQTTATLSATALDLTGGFTYFQTNAVVDVSSLTLSGYASLYEDAPASAIASPIGFAPGATAFLQFDADAIPGTGGSFTDAIDEFSQGDTIDLTSLGFVDGSTTATLSGSTLTVTNGTATDMLTLTNPGATTGFSTQRDGFGGTEIDVVCFAQGTRIATTRGDVAVEDLAVGDVALTASGAARPIRWLGHRTIDCRRHPRAFEVMPVRVAAHAFGDATPARDLYLSPGHPVLVGDGEGEVLVPIMCLVNGTSIVRASVDSVTYWHVELDAHDILLAEDLPAESFFDLGCRPWFGGADDGLSDPDVVPPGLHGRCRPVAIDGPLVEAERRRLDACFAMHLAAQCGWPVEAEVQLVF